MEYLYRSAHRPHAPERVRGTISVRGRVERIRTPRDAMRLGIGFVPEDRKKQGLVLGLRSRENAALPALRRFAHTGWSDLVRESAAVITSFDRVGLKSGRESAVQSISGGNQ